MLIRSKGLVLAMEEAELNDVPADDAKIAEGMSDIDSDALELSEDSTQIEDLEVAIEDAVEDTETLDGITDVMEDSIESGEGLSPEAAQMAEIAVESICKRLGIRNKNIIPAMESFGSSSSRLAATRIALEATEETKKGIWATIIEAFKRLGAMIAEFFEKLIGGLAKVKSVSKALRKKLSEIKGTKLKTRLIENPTLAKLLIRSEKDKKVDSEIHLAERVQNNLLFVIKFQEDLAKYSDKLLNEYNQIESVPFYKFKEKADAGKTFANSVMNDARNLSTSKSFSNFTVRGEIISESFRLLDKDLTVTADKVEDENGVTEPRVVFSYRPLEPTTPFNSIPVLNPDEARNLLDLIDKDVALIEKIKANGDPRKISSKFVAAIEKAIKIVEKGDNSNSEDTKDKIKYLKGQARNISHLTNSVSKVYKDIPADAIRTCQLVLKYIALSIKAYSEETDNKE